MGGSLTRSQFVLNIPLLGYGSLVSIRNLVSHRTPQHVFGSRKPPDADVTLRILISLLSCSLWPEAPPRGNPPESLSNHLKTDGRKLVVSCQLRTQFAHRAGKKGFFFESA